MNYPTTIEHFKDELSKRIANDTAELDALKAITVNIKHKNVSNASITGATVQPSKYSMNGSKELTYHWYGVSDYGNQKYEYSNIDISVYTGETVGYIKQQRTMTPQELRTAIDGIITARTESLDAIKRDLENAKQIVNRYNKLVNELNAFGENITWASRAIVKF